MPPESKSGTSVPEKNLYRIGEVARLAATKTFVLRYWETEFPMLKPVKSSSGHRMYRRQDLDTVLEIKRLLYDEGFTIAGARKHLRQGATASAPSAASSVSSNSAAPDRKLLASLRDELRAILTLLNRE
ncbi:MAG: MerR family transcriptional regulator [Acidobacteria bacterium]|nr:MerR family transcriptional regulator [Acidobacteriota bacterium]